MAADRQTDRQTDIHTTSANAVTLHKCSHTSVGLAQARPNKHCCSTAIPMAIYKQFLSPHSTTYRLSITGKIF